MMRGIQYAPEAALANRATPSHHSHEHLTILSTENGLLYCWTPGILLPRVHINSLTSLGHRGRIRISQR